MLEGLIKNGGQLRNLVDNYIRLLFDAYMEMVHLIHTIILI